MKHHKEALYIPEEDLVHVIKVLTWGLHEVHLHHQHIGDPSPVPRHVIDFLNQWINDNQDYAIDNAVAYPDSYFDKLPTNSWPCENCDGHVFVADEELDDHGDRWKVLAHVEVDGCDDPSPRPA